MAGGKWISYLRVRDDKRRKSNLGAQRDTVDELLNGGNCSLLKDFVEVERGKPGNRHQLEAALKACETYGAKLVIAKLGRLSRDPHFLLRLKKAGVNFVAADMPNATRRTVSSMVTLAHEERRMISRRMKRVLALAKRRGVKLGGDRGNVPSAKVRKLAAKALRKRATSRAADLRPIIEELQAGGATSLTAIAEGLNARGIATPRGTLNWRTTQVARVLKRLKQSA